MALNNPDLMTGAAGRDEILRAIADRIRHLPADANLGVNINQILPQVENVLESPEEKSLKHIRYGVGFFTFGLGIAIYFLLRELFLSEGNLVLAAAIVASIVGLGGVINGMFFSTPRNQQKKTLAEFGFPVDAPSHAAGHRATGKAMGEPAPQPTVAVTEGTTRQLSSGSQSDGQ
jgi:hypothetical protein